MNRLVLVMHGKQAIGVRVIEVILSNDSARGKRRLWSCCSDVQPRLDLCYPHMPRRHLFPWRVSFISFETRQLTKWMNFVGCSPFFTRETTVLTSCLRSYTPSPFWKWAYSEKNLLPFSGGGGGSNRVVSLESVSTAPNKIIILVIFWIFSYFSYLPRE